MVSIIVPTRNERENVEELLGRTLAALAAVAEPSEVVVVDDDSPDGTAAEVRRVAEALGARERVRVVVRRGDRGLARAVARGIREARGDLLVIMDADLSHPPELLPRLVEEVRRGRADLAVASRRVPGGGAAGWPLGRRVVSWAAGLAARPLVPVRDTTSGFMAFHRSCLDGVRLAPRGYKIVLEILARTRARRVAEVPFVFRDRRRGTSKLSGRVAGAYLVQLASLYRHRFPTAVRYLQFCLVGLAGAGVDWAVFHALYRGAGLDRLGAAAGGLAAQALSFLAAVGVNFALNAAWTFRDRRGGARFGAFLAVCAGGLALRSVAFAAVVRALAGPGGPGPGLPVAHLALAAGIVVASAWNFAGSIRWAFRAGPRPPRSPGGPENPDRRALALVLGLLLVRLAFAAVIPLSGDEAYYWQWSRHLAWGYYDHPPMIAYLIAGGVRLAGDTPLGVRLGAVALSSAAGWLLYVLARDLWGSARAGLWALGAAGAAPLLAAGALIATPDTPLVFFWTASIALALGALRSGRPRDWALAGAAVGLGLLSKHPMVLLPPALLAGLASSPEGRRALRGPGPWLAAGVAVLVSLPLLLWYLGQGGAPVLYQLRHGLGPAAGAPKAATGVRTFAGFLAGQAGVVTPVLFGVLVWAVWWSARAWKQGLPGREEARAALPLLLCSAILPFLVFAAASWLARSEPNWAAPAYPAAFVLLGGGLDRLSRHPSRRARALAWAALSTAALVTAAAQVELAAALLPLRAAPVKKVHDRSGVMAWAQRLRQQVDPGAPVLASGYRLASLLAFHLPDHPETDSPFETGSGSAYLAWRSPRRGGRSAWFFTPDAAPDEPERLFTRYRLVGARDDVRRGVRLGTLRAYYGRLRPGPGEAVAEARQ